MKRPYKRRKPHVPYNKGKGRGYAFLVAHTSYTGSECLPWPMARDDKGYGIVGHNGKVWKASRLMCVLANGEPPSDSHEAAHSCGNGHDGCVNPMHLSWKTGSQNQVDSVLHGTAGKKKGRTKAFLAPDQVEQIKGLRGRKSNKELGQEFGVHAETIAKIFRGDSWSGGPENYGRRIDPDERARMVARAKAMRQGGSTFQQIAGVLGVSRLTARNMNNET